MVDQVEILSNGPKNKALLTLRAAKRAVDAFVSFVTPLLSGVAFVANVILDFCALVALGLGLGEARSAHARAARARSDHRARRARRHCLR